MLKFVFLYVFLTGCSASPAFNKPINLEPKGVYTYTGQYDFDYDTFSLVGTDVVYSLIDCSSTDSRCIYTQFRTIIAPNCGDKFKPYMFHNKKISQLGQAKIAYNSEKIVVDIYQYGEDVLGETYHSLTYYSPKYGVVAVSTVTDDTLENIKKDNDGKIIIDENKLYYGDRTPGLFACANSIKLR